jgi:hypothetical protein
MLSSDDAVGDAVVTFNDYIKSEVLALSITTIKAEGETVDLNGHACTLSITKA